MSWENAAPLRLEEGVRLMGVRSGATGTAFGLLLALFLLPSARADSLSFTFSANQTWCAKYGNCAHSGSGTLTTDPLSFTPTYRNVYPVTSMTGSLDGSPISLLRGYYPAVSACGLPSTQFCVTEPNTIGFTANGQNWEIHNYSVGPWPTFLISTTNPLERAEPIDLTITAPEPSTLLFLIIGSLIVISLALLKNRLSLDLSSNNSGRNLSGARLISGT